MNILEIFNNSPINQFDKVYRYSGIPIPDLESVGTHINRGISLFFFMLPNLKVKKKDIKDFVYKFYLHDVPETLTGDIIRKYKYYSDKQISILKETEMELTKNEFPNLYEDIYNCKDDTMSGAFVAIIDIFQCIFFLYSQYKKSNSNFIKNKIKNESFVYVENILENKRSIIGEKNYNYLNNMYTEMKNVI